MRLSDRRSAALKKLDFVFSKQADFMDVDELRDYFVNQELQAFENQSVEDLELKVKNFEEQGVLSD